MRFSVRFNNDLPMAAYPELARAAEAAGFDQFWVSDDLFLRGVWPILSACAVATSRIRLGTCIVNPYTCHPAEIAMQAAALDELSGGRLLLGLAAGATDFLGWVGIPHQHPLATTAQAIHTLRALFRGQRPAHTGQPPRGWTDEAYMRFATRDIPIYLGAMSPRMHRLIGELADGGLPLLFPPERYTSVAERVRDGAESAGRNLADIDLAACVWVSVADDAEQAAAALRDKVAYYGHAFSDEILATLGLQRDAFTELNRLIQEQNNPQAAAALVTDQMLRVGIVGNGRQVRQRVADLAEQGATHLSFGPPLGPDPRAAIAILGRDVISELR